MSWDKSIGALSIKIRASVQFLAAGRDIRVPLYCTIALRLRRALLFPLDFRAVLIQEISIRQIQQSNEKFCDIYYYFNFLSAHRREFYDTEICFE